MAEESTIAAPDALASPAGNDIPPSVPPPASAPTVSAGSPGQPHAGLVNMLQGMFLGLDAFAKAAATGGREGGVQEVIQAQNQAAQLKLQQQKAKQELNESQVRIQHTQAMTNTATAQLQILQHEAPLRFQQLVNENQRSMVDLLKEIGLPPSFILPMIQGQDTSTHMEAVSSKAGGDLVNNTAIPVHDDKFAGPGTTTGFPFSALMTKQVTAEQAAPTLTSFQNAINEAKVYLDAKDPALQMAQGKLDQFKQGQTFSAADILHFNQQTLAPLSASVGRVKETQAFQTKQAELKEKQQKGDPLFKLENDPAEMTGDKAPAAVALLSSKLKDPNLSAEDRPRVQRLLNQANVAQKNALAFDAAKQRAMQAAKDGDPNAAADLLGQGLVAPSQLISTRNPRFAQQAFSAAQAKYPGWNAQKAEAQYKYATNPQTQNTLNMVQAMTDKGGSIDIATDAAKKLPQMDSATVNKVFNAAATEFGGKQATDFHTAMLGLADEYSKVMGGGVSSDQGRQQALDLLKASYSKGQFEGAVAVMKRDIAARQAAMVRDNPALKAMYQNPFDKAQADVTPQEKPVYLNGKLVGYSVDGKTMRKAE